MEAIQTYTDVTPEELMRLAAQYNTDGYRLAQICATRSKDKIDLIYSFSRELELLNLRLPLENGQTVRSISDIYTYSYLYENEIRELYGVDITGINVDFKGHFYKKAEPSPFGIKPEIEQKNGQNNG